MTVRVSDPFGLVELGRVVPDHGPAHGRARAPSRSPTIPLGGAWTGSGDNRPRAFATGSAEDVTVREYRHGDDLRRVHWRSSARIGELMVRREEQPWQSRATLFLDNRARGPPRPGHRLVARGRRLGDRLDRRPPEPARVHGPAGHRHRRGPHHRLALPRRRAQHRARCSSRWPSSRPPTSRGSRPNWLADPQQRRPAGRRRRRGRRPRRPGLPPDAPPLDAGPGRRARRRGLGRPRAARPGDPGC